MFTALAVFCYLMRGKSMEKKKIRLPQDVFGKYSGMFNDKQLEALVDLTEQSYETGVEDGKNEMYDEMYNK